MAIIKKCKNCGCRLNKNGKEHYEEAEDENGVFCDSFKFIGFANNTPVPIYKQCCCEKPEKVD